MTHRRGLPARRVVRSATSPTPRAPGRRSYDALHSDQLHRRTRSTRGHAPRRQAGRTGLRGRHPHERARRAAHLPRRLPRAVEGGQPAVAIGTGSPPPTSRPMRASRRSSPASPARSCAISSSIRLASTSPGSPPVAPWPPSWPRPTQTCTRRSGCTPGSPTAPRTTSAPRFAAMRTGGTPAATSAVPLIVIHGDRDPIVAPVNADKLIASRLAAGDITGHDAPITTRSDSGRGYTRTVHRNRRRDRRRRVLDRPRRRPRLVRRQSGWLLHRPHKALTPPPR